MADIYPTKKPLIVWRNLPKSVTFCIILYHFPKLRNPATLKPVPPGAMKHLSLPVTIQLRTVPSWSDAQVSPTSRRFSRVPATNAITN